MGAVHAFEPGKLHETRRYDKAFMLLFGDYLTEKWEG